MGNFNQHLTYGYLAYSVVPVGLAVAVATGRLPIAIGGLLGVVALPLTISGAVFPDIDHQSSKPHQLFRRAVFLGGTLGAFYVQFTQSAVPIRAAVGIPPSGTTPPVVFHLGLVCTSLVIGGGLSAAVARFRPKHRGITHRLPVGVGLGCVVGGVAWHLAVSLVWLQSAATGVVTGGAFLLGFVSHLHCDRMLVPACKTTTCQAQAHLTALVNRIR